jgi:ParB family transcriptional regulator, chromosome partitioning protein
MKKQFARLFGLGEINEESTIVHGEPEDITVNGGQARNVPAALANDKVKVVSRSVAPLHNVQAVLLSDIDVNSFQPRKTFHDHSLEELSQSIKEYGVIQPILVRRNGDRFELVAGERRLRATRLAGLDTIPAIVKDLSHKESAELAMIENLQREDLNFMEEAEGYQLLLTTFGLTQEELAVRVGKSQSTIANKLRLLKLSLAVRNEISQEIFTERHARALLKLPGEQHQLEVVKLIKEKEMTVRQTEECIEQRMANISREIADATPKQRIIRVFKDIRIFVNTIHNVVDEMRKAGLDIKVKETSNEDYVTIELQIPKRK